MAGYFISETYSCADAGAVYLSISGDSAFFAPSATIAMTGAGAEVVHAGADARIVVSGSLFAADTAVAGEASGGGSFTITGSGQVVGDRAFDLAGTGNTLLNGGFVNGEVAFEDGANRLLNTGTLSNDTMAVAVNSHGAGSSLTNSGAITSLASAIRFVTHGNAAGSNDLVNSGTISGKAGAVIDSAAAANALHLGNSGQIGPVGHDAPGLAVRGGAGDDIVINTGTIAGDILGAGGDDQVDTSGGTLVGAIYGGAGDDHLIGMAHAATLLDGGSGADRLEGGTGSDTASYATANAGVTVDMLHMDLNTGDAAGDSFVSIERVRGSSFADLISGDDAGNRISGNGGADVLAGRGGSDVLYGGDGDDVLDGGAGNDQLNGQAGTDTASYASATAAVTVSLGVMGAQDTHGAGLDTLSSIENLAGSRLGDHLTGSAGDNRLAGGNGDDVLDGGLGHDLLIGGKGHDSFVFSTAPSAANVDTIADYVVADDTIDLAAAAFRALGPAGALSTEAFFVGTAAHDASDRIVYNPLTGGLFYDADGNGAGAAIEIAQMHTHLALTSTEFVVI